MYRFFVCLAMVATAIQTPTFASAQQCSCDATVGDACGDCSCGECNNGCGLLGVDFWTRPRLFGNLFGTESCLAEHGIVTDIILGQYYQGVTSGGNQQTDAYGGKLDYYITFQGGKFGLNKGFNVSMHAETRFGQDITSAAGGLTLPNAPLLYPLPGNYHGTNITGLFASQTLFDGKAQAMFGKLNAVDLVTGIFPNVGGGREGFMNVNALVTALPWLRFVNLSMWGGGVWAIKDEGIGSGIIFFGTESTTTDWDFSPGFENGVGILGWYRHFYEIGGKPGYVFVGVGGSTKEYASLDPSDWLEIPGAGLRSTAQKQPWSIAPYLYQVFWQDPCNKERNAYLFMGGSVADSNPSFSNWNVFAAIEGLGLNPSRPGDRMGISGWYNGLTNDFKALTATVGVPTQDNWGMELYYNWEVTPCFHLTGDLQVLENSNSAADTALVLGMRAIIDL
jgi:porin